MSNPKPSNLKSEALTILAEIPHTFIQLANTNAENAKHHYTATLRDIHRRIATTFGEPRPTNLGVTSIVEDLTRWVNIWTWHPHASRWVADLRHALHIADGEVTGDSFRWIEKPDAICPRCLTLGHLEYQETTWDHRCGVTVWTWKQYRAAVRDAAERAGGRAA